MLTFFISTGLVFVVVVSWFVKTLTSREDWRLLSPFGVLMLCYLFYCAIGPWVSISFTEMRFQDIDFYGSIDYSALMALISFFFACVGYRVYRKRGQLVLPELKNDGFIYSLVVYLIFFALFLLSQLGNLTQVYNIFGNAKESELESILDIMGFQAYLYLMMSCCVAPAILMWVSAKRSAFKMSLAVVLIVNLMLVYLSTGFRLRIIFLALSLMSLYFLRLRATPGWFAGRKKFVMNRLALVILGAGVFVVAMSTARKYGRGVDLEALKEASGEQVAVSTFNDSAIYFCAGQVFQYETQVSDGSRYTYLETYKAAMKRMIPSAIIGEKALPQTIVVISEAMGGTTASYSSGFAVPFYAENFISFGFIGLAVGSFALGAGCAKLANLAIRKPTPYILLFYALMTGFVFIYFHRGYFPQTLDYFMFMVGVPMIALLPLRKRMKV